MHIDCIKKATVFDYDGVLYLPYTRQPNPIAQAIIETLVQWGCTIHVVSYRPREDAHHIRATLKKLGLPRHLTGYILLRPPNTQEDEISWKTHAYQTLHNKGIQAALISDDNPQALEAARKTWPQACLHLYTPPGTPQPYNPTPHCLHLHHALLHGASPQ